MSRTQSSTLPMAPLPSPARFSGRELPPAEWGTLTHTELGSVGTSLAPGAATRTPMTTRPLTAYDLSPARAQSHAHFTTKGACHGLG